MPRNHSPNYKEVLLLLPNTVIYIATILSTTKKLWWFEDKWIPYSYIFLFFVPNWQNYLGMIRRCVWPSWKTFATGDKFEDLKIPHHSNLSSPHPPVLSISVSLSLTIACGSNGSLQLLYQHHACLPTALTTLPAMMIMGSFSETARPNKLYSINFQNYGKYPPQQKSN